MLGHLVCPSSISIVPTPGELCPVETGLPWAPPNRKRGTARGVEWRLPGGGGNTSPEDIGSRRNARMRWKEPVPIGPDRSARHLSGPDRRPANLGPAFPDGSGTAQE